MEKDREGFLQYLLENGAHEYDFQIIHQEIKRLLLGKLWKLAAEWSLVAAAVLSITPMLEEWSENTSVLGLNLRKKKQRFSFWVRST